MTHEPADMHYIARQLKGMITELERLGYTHQRDRPHSADARGRRFSQEPGAGDHRRH